MTDQAARDRARTDEPRRRLIGVTVAARTTAEAAAVLAEVARVADVAEVRLDLMAEHDLRRLLRDRPCPVVITNRAAREGGSFRGSEEERLRPLREAIDLGAEYVDVEADAAHLVGDRGQTRLIVSRHDFAAMPPDFAWLHRRLAESGADVVKVVGTAHSVADNLPVLGTLAQATVPTMAIAMGPHGLLSRVLALRAESCLLTYAALGDKAVAPGQLSIATMREVYRVSEIGPATAVFGLLSVQTVSNAMLARLNAATRAAGIDAVWVPVVPAPGEPIPDLLQALKRLPLSGYLVADSARLAAVEAVDEVESADRAGGIGAIVVEGGRLVGIRADDEMVAASLVLSQAR